MECDFFHRGEKCSRKSEVGVCGYHKKHRHIVSVHETIGRRETMEDKYTINRNSEYELYAVFDGHGGIQASTFCKEYFDDFDLDAIDPDIDEMAKTFHEIILGLHGLSKGKVKESGTTASIVLLYKKKKEMIVVNIGDSRVMVIGNDWSKIITKDHNINSNKRDLSKIIEKGGKVSEGKNKYLMSQKGGVNLTRTIGDHDFKELIRLPEISIVDLTEVRTIMISCDGMWEETKEDMIRKIILEGKNLPSTCKKLVEQAYNDGSEDNITVMLIGL